MHFESVFRLVSEAGKTLKLKKWNFASNSVDYLEHVVASGQQHVARKTK